MHTDGCMYIDSSIIIVRAPEIKLIYKGGAYCQLNSLVEFYASTQFTDSIRWDFGDGTILNSHAQKVTHIYNKGGSFIPKVTLLNGAHCSLEIPQQDSIHIDEIKPGFKLQVVNDCAKSNYVFKDTSRSYFAITKRNWRIAQPQQTNSIGIQAAEIKQIYTQAGDYEAKLELENTIGCGTSIKAKFNVVVYQFPQANINAINESCRFNLMEIKSAINSKDPLLERYWNLGNGKTSSDSIVSVYYSNAGNFIVQLKVSTINSCYDSAYKQLSIHPLPVITLSPEKNVCQGDSLELKATGAMSYIWKDQNENLLCNNCNSVKIVPTKNTQYKVIGFNEFGCSNISSTNVHIVSPLKISVNPIDSICFGGTKKLTVNGAATYTWLPTSGLSNYNMAITYASPSSTTLYQVIGKDAYQCFADTASIKLVVGKPTSIHLGHDTMVITGTPIKLNIQNIPPEIVQWKWAGRADFSCVYCASPTVKVIFDEALSVTATNVFGCVSTDTILVKTFCSGAEVFIPNAFTPDGDGINDVLIVQGRGIKIIKNLKIFSRWGEVVFEKSNFQPGDRSAGWDGQVRGKSANSDVFIYMCEAICERGTPFVIKGNVAIIK